MPPPAGRQPSARFDRPLGGPPFVFPPRPSQQPRSPFGAEGARPHAHRARSSRAPQGPFDHPPLSGALAHRSLGRQNLADSTRSAGQWRGHPPVGRASRRGNRYRFASSGRFSGPAPRRRSRRLSASGPHRAALPPPAPRRASPLGHHRVFRVPSAGLARRAHPLRQRRDRPPLEGIPPASGMPLGEPWHTRRAPHSPARPPRGPARRRDLVDTPEAAIPPSRVAP